jgi:hypothetical protein
MKFLVLALLLVTTKTYAAGCVDNYHSVSLTEEVAVTNLGSANAHLECNSGKCSIWTSQEISVGTEQHTLKSMDVTQKQMNITSLGNLEVKIYRQTFDSMCSQMIRYTLGLDYDGVRFRELEDITFID